MITIEEQKEILHNLAKEWQPQNTGKGWNVNSDEPVCTWYGIICDAQKFVTEIQLFDNKLKGKILNELGELIHLTRLVLRLNDLSGTLPESLTGLVNLVEFDFSNNAIIGHLPNFRSDVLVLLKGRNNHLKGTIPEDIGYLLPNLDQFIFPGNSLEGTLPNSISIMHKLDIFDVSNNIIDGKIPHLIGDLKELNGLFLQFNSLIGTIPPSLSRSAILTQIYLENNLLSGTIPASLGDLPKLKDFSADGNKFTGTVPSDLCKMNLNENFFAKNEAQGRDPARDACSSVACPVNTVSEEGVFPCSPCKDGYFSPYIGKNDKCYALTQKQVLDDFYDSTNGPNWRSSSGWGMENVHPCAYAGVTCNFAQQVTNITLTNHGLTGPISAELGFLRHLAVLNLADNALTGYLPSDLRFAPLEFLDVSGNKLTGEVPSMLCLTGDINENGRDGIFQCDVIACPKGTYSQSGFAEGIKGLAFRVCRPCPSNHYLASRYCNAGFSLSTMVDSQTAGSSNGLVLVLIIIISALCMSFVCRPAVSSKQQQRSSSDVLSDAGGSERAVAFNLDKSMQSRRLMLTKSSRLGDANEAVHPLGVIEIPTKENSGPLSAPLGWDRKKQNDEDDWLSMT